MGLRSDMSVSNLACRGLRSGMSVSDEACRGLQWVSYQACRSPMKHVEVFNGSPIRHVGLRCSMSRSPMYLRSGMSVSDGSPIGIRWVSDNNNIFVNSSFYQEFLLYISFRALFEVKCSLRFNFYVSPPS